jgi:MFS family permease
MISNLGDGISFVAMPLLARSLTGDERLVSLTTFALFLPWMLIALPVGVVVDRVDRQLLMVAANVVRALLFGGIAVAAVDDRLSIWGLVGILVVIGACEVVFDSTAQAFLPMLVEPHQLSRANGLLFAAEVVAGSLAGLSIGALLFDASVGLPFSVDAMTFSIAALLILSISSVRIPPVALDRPGDRRLRVGLRWLFDHHLLRTLAAMFTITNLGLMFGQGIFVLYATDELGLDSLGYAILLAITAMGAASGGLISDRVIGRLGLRASIVLPYLVFGAAQLVIGLAPPAWMVAAAGFLLGMAITIWNVVTVTIRQRVIPTDRFGRVNSVYRWLGASASAAGALGGGFLAYSTNLRAPFLMGGAIALLAAALFARPVLSSLRNIEN